MGNPSTPSTVRIDHAEAQLTYTMPIASLHGQRPPSMLL